MQVDRDQLLAGTRDVGATIMVYVEEWGPRILAAVLILLIGYIVARAAKWAIANVVNRTPLARHAHRHSGVEGQRRDPRSVGAQIGNAVFWIVILVALVLAAQPLGLAAVTTPLGQMLNDFGSAIPNLVGAGLIFFVGYIVASVAKKAIEAILSAAQTERLTEQVGMRQPTDPTALPRMVGGIVFALIIIPVAIAALEQLNIRSISEPATAMLRVILDAIPKVIAAGIILALAYVIGRFASRLLIQFLENTGFDRTMAQLGFSAASGAAMPQAGAAPVAPTPEFRASRIIGGAVFVAIILFGLMEAFRQLNFVYGSRMMAEILSLLGSVIFGALIIVAAVVIARFVASAIQAEGGEGQRVTAGLVRIAIITLGVAIGLRFMGLADDIINLAFGLILGAIAVAFAIAFGIGGREPASKVVQQLLGRASDKGAPPIPSPTPTSRASAGTAETGIE